MPSLKTYGLFISHAWSYGDSYTRLVNMLQAAPNFYFRNYSAPEDKPICDPGTPIGKRALQEAIENKIRCVNCVLVVSGMYYNHREWMQYEIDTAKAYLKPIIAVRPRGGERTPIEISNCAAEVVGWNASSIVDAIRLRSV